MINFFKKKINKKKIKIKNFGYLNTYKKNIKNNNFKKNKKKNQKIIIPYFKCSKKVLYFLNNKN